LRKAVDAALQVLNGRLENFDLTLHEHFEDVALRIDQTRLEQILVNLVGNALDAMQAQPLPELWLEGEIADGRYRLYVRDNGHGIGPEARKHLFEPFFTTKPGEHGLGLGLTLSASLAAAAGGSLSAEHPSSGGTAFILSLPLLDTPAPPEAEPI
jgi:two-component system sensor histidine kinase AauS